MNGILASEASLASNGSLTATLIAKKSETSAAGVAKAPLRSKAASRSRRVFDQPLMRGLLDARSSSLSLKTLARAAAFSGKRLVLEIRDENPVRIVRTSTRGM